jgi:gas vesicle protein
MADKTSSGDFFAGFLVGALVGAAAALLLAPQSGEETRTLILDKGIELRDQAEELQSQAKERADELQTRMKEAVEQGRTAATGRKEDLLAQIDQAPPAEEPPVTS